MAHVVKHDDFLTDPKINELWLDRDEEAHKGAYGYVMIIGGSRYFTGAPALSAMAALRAGADLAAVLAPEVCANTIASFSPNLISVPYKGEFLNNAAVEEFKRNYEKFDSFAIGGGLCAKNASKPALIKIIDILTKNKKKFILDADALKMVSHKDVSECVITPHAKEYEIFSKGIGPRELAKKMCVMLKGNIDRIFYKEKVAESHTGNPGMTVGGTGDTLVGILGALLANTDDFFNTACAAAFVNGTAGDLAFEKFGNGLLATDVIDFIPEAIKGLK